MSVSAAVQPAASEYLLCRAVPLRGTGGDPAEAAQPAVLALRSRGWREAGPSAGTRCEPAGRERGAPNWSILTLR